MCCFRPEPVTNLQFFFAGTNDVQHEKFTICLRHERVINTSEQLFFFLTGPSTPARILTNLQFCLSVTMLCKHERFTENHLESYFFLPT